MPDEEANTTLDAAQSLIDGAKGISAAMNVITPPPPSQAGAAASTPAQSFDPLAFARTAYQRVIEGIKGAKSDVAGATAAATAASVQEQQGAQTIAAGKSMAAAVTAASEAKQDADAISSSAMFGVTPGAPSQAVVAAAAEVQKGLAAYTQRAADIRERNSVGFLDDPIQYMVNRVVVPVEKTKQAEQETALNALQATILKAQSATEGSVQIAKATDSIDAYKMLDGLNQQIAGEAATAAASSAMKLASFGLQGATVRDAQNQAQFQDALQVADQNTKQQELFLSQGYKALQEQMYNLRITEKASTDADKAALDQGLGNLGNFIGLPGLNLQQLKSGLRPADQKEAIDRMLGFGAVTSGGVLGSSAGQIITDLNTVNAQGNEAMNYVRGRVQNVLTTAINSTTYQKQYGTKSFAQLPAQAKAQFTDAVIGEMVKNEFANRQNSNGIYSPGPLKTTLPVITKAAPELGKAILPIAAANPMAATDPQTLWNLQMSRIKDGSLTPAQAAVELSESYRAINADISSTRNLQQLAFPLPKDYKAKVLTTSGMLFNPAKTLDMTSIPALQAAFTRAQIEASRATQDPALLPVP